MHVPVEPSLGNLPVQPQTPDPFRFRTSLPISTIFLPEVPSKSRTRSVPVIFRTLTMA